MTDGKRIYKVSDPRGAWSALVEAETDGGGGQEPGMPIEERLRRYARHEAIEEAGDKVVELPQRPE